MSRLSTKLALKSALLSSSSLTTPAPLKGNESSLQISDAIRESKQLVWSSSNGGSSLPELRPYAASLYRAASTHRVVLTQKEVDDAAFFHGLCAMDALLLFEENKDLQTELDWKVESLELVLLIDHSGSMSNEATSTQRLELSQLIDQVRHILDQADKQGIRVRVHPFGDQRHESKTGFSADEYRSHFASSITFNGNCTELNPAWDAAVSQTQGRPCVAFLVSDGQFNGSYDVRNLRRFEGVRSLVFYAPTWARDNVTHSHARTLASVVPETATYNGDVEAPHMSKAVDLVLATCGTGKSVPSMSGRTLLGTISVPNTLLLPSGMAQVWRTMLSTASFRNPTQHGQSLTFLRTLFQLFSELDSSARQNLERCLLSAQFFRLMSIVSPILKTAEAFLGGEVPMQDTDTDESGHDDEREVKGESKEEKMKRERELGAEEEKVYGDDEEVKLDDESNRRREQTMAAVTKLYKLLTYFRNYVSSEKPKLLEKYVHNPKRMEELQTVFLSATTVSERSQILETHSNSKKWACVGTLHLPSLATCAVGMPLFLDLFTKRLRTPFTSPETPLLDNLLVALFQQSAILPIPDSDSKDDVVTQLDVIPVFRNKLTKEIDVLAVIRLLPTHFVREQVEYKKTHKEEPLLPDFTYQPITAKRILYLLAVAQKQGAQFPSWLAQTVVVKDLDPALTKDTDDDNLSVYWMHVLLQLAQEGRDNVLLTRLKERLLAWTVKFFVLKHLRGPAAASHRIPYEVPTYGDALPFVTDCKSELAYVVRMNTKGQMLNHLTHKSYDDDNKVITNEKEIARLYERNLLCRGALIRPTYLTDGQVTLWSDTPTSVAQAMGEQLQYLGRTELDSGSPFASAPQIQAHMHTMADLHLFTAIPDDTKDEDVKRIIQRIVDTGAKAKPIMDKLIYSVPATIIVDHLVSVAPSPYISGLVRSVFAIPNPPPKDWICDVDFMIGHAQQYQKERKEESKEESKEEIKGEGKREGKEELKVVAVVASSPTLVPKNAQSSLDDIFELYTNQFKAAVTCTLTSPSLLPPSTSSASTSTGPPLVKSSAGSKTYLLF